MSEKIVFRVGQHFDDYKHFKKVFKDYVIQNGFKQRCIHNNNIKIASKCVAPSCTWRLHAFQVSYGVSIRKDLCLEGISMNTCS